MSEHAGPLAGCDIRVGTVIMAEINSSARKPALSLVVDFGAALGKKRSSAQLTDHYRPEELIGRQVLALVNTPPRQIGRVRSEVLVLGLPDAEGAVVLIAPDQSVPNGGRVY